MDRANRAGVVVYTLDARGLVTGLLSAEDDAQPRPGTASVPGGTGLAVQAIEAVTKPMEARRAYLHASQASLVYIAEQTGGFAVLNNNDLSQGFRRVLDDLRGYYLLGYERPSETPAWGQSEIRVRVKRPGLKVRARKALFGPADPRRTVDAVPADPLDPGRPLTLQRRLSRRPPHRALRPRSAHRLVRALALLRGSGWRSLR